MRSNITRIIATTLAGCTITLAGAQEVATPDNQQTRERVAAIVAADDIPAALIAARRTLEDATLARDLVRFIASSESERDRAGGRAALAALKLSPRATIEAMIPILYDADAAVGRLARSVAREFEDRSASRAPDFTPYRAIIEDALRANADISENLVRLMFESDPGTALLTLMRANQMREPAELRIILWAERAVDENLWRWRHGFMPSSEAMPEAVEQLQLLSKHDAWWARYFVVETMRQSTALRDDATLEALKADADALVRAAAIRAIAARPTAP